MPQKSSNDLIDFDEIMNVREETILGKIVVKKSIKKKSNKKKSASKKKVRGKIYFLRSFLMFFRRFGQFEF